MHGPLSYLSPIIFVCDALLPFFLPCYSDSVFNPQFKCSIFLTFPAAIPIPQLETDHIFYNLLDSKIIGFMLISPLDSELDGR